MCLSLSISLSYTHNLSLSLSLSLNQSTNHSLNLKSIKQAFSLPIYLSVCPSIQSISYLSISYPFTPPRSVHMLIDCSFDMWMTEVLQLSTSPLLQSTEKVRLAPKAHIHTDMHTYVFDHVLTRTYSAYTHVNIFIHT